MTAYFPQFDSKRFNDLYKDLCAWANKVSIVTSDGKRLWKVGWY